jgi:hypothetical protein
MIDRFNVVTNLVTRVEVEQQLKAVARTDSTMMATTRTDILIAFNVGTVKHVGAAFTLDPQALRYRAAITTVSTYP